MPLEGSDLQKGATLLSTAISRAWCILLLADTAAFSQSFLGSISGAITDASDAVLQQAKVDSSPKNGQALSTATTTNASGAYSFSDLGAGTYTISVTATGFKEARSADIILTTQKNKRVVRTPGLKSARVRRRSVVNEARISFYTITPHVRACTAARQS